MKKIPNKLRVVHYPQVPCEPFVVDVKDEVEAKKIIDVLANQHLFLFKNKFIPDYANIVSIEMWDDTPNEEDGGKPYGWSNYHNEEEEGMEWAEFEETYLTDKKEVKEKDNAINSIKK